MLSQHKTMMALVITCLYTAIPYHTTRAQVPSIETKTSLPFLLKNIEIEFSPSDKSRYLLTGTGTHSKASEKNYVVMVPLKLNTVEFEIRTVNVPTVKQIPFRMNSSLFRLKKIDGSEYPLEQFKKYISDYKTAFVAYEFQTLDSEFLDAVRPNIPIVKVIQPSLEDLNNNLQMGMGVTGNGPYTFGHNEFEKMSEHIYGRRKETGQK